VSFEIEDELINIIHYQTEQKLGVVAAHHLGQNKIMVYFHHSPSGMGVFSRLADISRF